MTIVGKIIKKVVEFDHYISRNDKISAFEQQKKTLKKLLLKSKKTSFGKNFQFNQILQADDPTHAFQVIVPTFNYEKLFDGWWIRTLNGERNVTWPGKVKYFALTSGTSNASSKKIPVTQDMIHSIRRVGFTHLKTLTHYDLPDEFLSTDMLMLGGCTRLQKIDKHYEGDLSGIITRTKPKWLNKFSKPGRKISNIKDWNDKLEKIVKEAHKWDIGAVMGVPAWITILMEKIIEHYEVDNIHDIWPNLKFYAFGGVPVDSYKTALDRMTRTPLIYLNTYLASEGFFSYQKEINDLNSMKLVLDNGIFYEFVPFNEKNFSDQGELLRNAETLTIDKVEEGVDYALLISTCAGAWRYLIGDTIRFVSKARNQIVITGRTQHYMSVCGEHVSVDNMIQAIKTVSAELGVGFEEFTLTARKVRNRFTHHWYLSCEHPVDKELVALRLDEALKDLNDDYATERKTAINKVIVDILPIETFYGWMKANGKFGGQHKFPRVLKGEKLENWKSFLSNHKQSSLV